MRALLQLSLSYALLPDYRCDVYTLRRDLNYQSGEMPSPQKADRTLHSSPRGPELWVAQHARVSIEERAFKSPVEIRARILTGEFCSHENCTFDINRSAIAIDGETPFLLHFRKLHRSALSRCDPWVMMTSTSQVACGDDKFVAHNSKPALKSLMLMGDDPIISELLHKTFGIDAGRCFYGNHILLFMSNANTTLDHFHVDKCEPRNSRLRGVTLLTYPHDRWNSTWHGHFELSGLGDVPLAGFAPLPGRVLALDGCVYHRATTPTASARPLSRDIRLSPALQRTLDMSWSSLQQFRFATVSQLVCDVKRPTVVDGEL